MMRFIVIFLCMPVSLSCWFGCDVSNKEPQTPLEIAHAQAPVSATFQQAYTIAAGMNHLQQFNTTLSLNAVWTNPDSPLYESSHAQKIWERAAQQAGNLSNTIHHVLDAIRASRNNKPVKETFKVLQVGKLTHEGCVKATLDAKRYELLADLKALGVSLGKPCIGDIKKLSPLSYSLQKEDILAVEHLADLGVPIGNALVEIPACKNLHFIDLLIARGANPHGLCTYGNTVRSLAVLHDNKALADHLAHTYQGRICHELGGSEALARIIHNYDNAYFDEILKQEPELHKESACIDAINASNIYVLQQLLSNGLQLKHVKEKTEIDPLHAALVKEYTPQLITPAISRMILFLLEHDAPLCNDHKEVSPLYKIVTILLYQTNMSEVVSNLEKSIDALLQRKIPASSLHTPNGRFEPSTIMQELINHLNCNRGKIYGTQTIRKLFKYWDREYHSAPSNLDVTELEWSTLVGNHSKVKELLDTHNADNDEQIKRENTNIQSLYYAFILEDVAMAQLLLEHPSYDVAVKKVALPNLIAHFIECDHEKIDVCRKLIDPSSFDKESIQRLFQAALDNVCWQAVEWLLAYKPDLTKRIDVPHGWAKLKDATYLHHITNNWNTKNSFASLQCIKALLQAGIDPLGKAQEQDRYLHHSRIKEKTARQLLANTIEDTEANNYLQEAHKLLEAAEQDQSFILDVQKETMSRDLCSLLSQQMPLDSSVFSVEKTAIS